MEDRRVSERRAEEGLDRLTVERRIAERRELPLEQRVEALEALAIEYAEAAQQESNLLSGVNRLGSEVGGLNAILTQVDEQQQLLAQFGRVAHAAKAESSSANRNAEASAFAAEEARATAKIERKLFLRRLYTSLGTAVVVAVAAVIGGAWLTDRHLQKCLIDGPTTDDQQNVCNVTFPGHDHPQGESIQAILLRQVEASRAGCERDNVRVRTNISQTEQILALMPPGRGRTTLEQTVRDFQEIITDCDAAYPLPDGSISSTR